MNICVLGKIRRLALCEFEDYRGNSFTAFKWLPALRRAFVLIVMRPNDKKKNPIVLEESSIIARLAY